MPFHDEETSKPAPSKSKKAKRKFGRIRQHEMTCNIGLILDISAGGMRVRCRRKPPAKFEITLHHFPLPGPLFGNISWTKRVGLFNHEVGVVFENPSPEVVQHLSTIAGCGVPRIISMAQSNQAA